MHFSNKLIDWYLVNKRDLPWRNTTNPYFIWLSEIILQQTQVKQGWPYYEAFVAKFPTVFDLANANEADVLHLWQGLGYYSRARNLHASAKYIANELNGVFPSTYKTIKELKGVGDYTASAIASICFNEVQAVVDGNVYRVLSRIYGIDTPINTSAGQKEFKSLAQSLIAKKDPATFNQAIMDFGSQVCKPKLALCNGCVFSKNCKAFNLDEVANLPVKLKKTKVTNKYFNFLVFIDGNGSTLVEQRLGKGIWQNLYQFPLVESTEPATESFIDDELVALGYNKFEVSLYNIDSIIHKLSHQHLHTKFWVVQLDNELKDATEPKDLSELAFPVLITNFLRDFNF